MLDSTVRTNMASTDPHADDPEEEEGTEVRPTVKTHASNTAANMEKVTDFVEERELDAADVQQVSKPPLYRPCTLARGWIRCRKAVG